MMNSSVLMIIALIGLISWQIITIPNGFTINQRHFLVGKKIVQIDQLIQQYSTNWTYTYVSIPTPEYNYFNWYYWQSANSPCISFGDLQTSNLTYINIKLRIANCQYLECGIYISTPNANSIQRLSITYIFFSYFPYNYQHTPYQFKCYTFNHDFGNNITNNILDTLTIVEKILLTDFSSELDAPSLPIFINGIVASSTDSTMTKSILLSAQLTSNQTVNVSITSSSPIPTYLEYLSYSFCTNTQASTSIQQQYQQNYKIYSGELVRQSEIKLSYSNNHLLMNSINTFIGLTSFTISNQNIFNMSSSIDNQHSLSTTSSSFDKLQITYFILYADYCSYKSPFKEQFTGRCYETCPQNTVKNFQFLCSCQKYISGQQACFKQSQSATVSIIAISFGLVSIIIHLIFIVYFFANNNCNKNLKQADGQGDEAIGGHGQHISRQEMAINSIDVTLMHLPQLDAAEGHMQIKIN